MKEPWVHPKFAVRQISENREQYEIYFNIKKSAGGIRLRFYYRIHKIYFFVSKNSLVLSASTRSSVKT